MSPRLTQWLALAAIIALGAAGTYWLLRDQGTAGNSPSGPAALAQSGTLPASANPPKASDASGLVDIRGIAGGSAPPPSNGSAATEQSSDLQLDFQAPASTRLGEAFDLNVTINMRVPIDRLVFEVDYDPRLLRARMLEEVDYTNRPSGMRTFALEHVGDGRATVTMGFGAGTPGPMPSMSLAAAQFEALAPGPAQINILTISAIDRSGRPVASAASGKSSRIAIN